MGVPLLAADEFIGMISVRSRLDSGSAPDEISFIQAIAIHASLALQMARLAEIARQAVVAEERREAMTRSKEALGRIADAGRAPLQRLAENPHLEAFLEHVLAVSMEQFEALGACVWLGDPSTGACSRYISYQRGDPNLKVEPGYKYHFDPGSEAEIEAIGPVQGRIDVHRGPEFERFTAYQEIPLFFGVEVLGVFVLQFDHERVLPPEEEGLAHTLSNQVVLALELTRLSEKAKDAALAYERNRMAADVHDTLAQAFAATLLHLRSMEMTRVSVDSQSHWKFAQENAAQGLAAARRAMNEIRTAPPANSLTLAERLAERVRQVAARSRSTSIVRFQVRGEVATLCWAVEDELERIAGEALFNAERHAAAGVIEVELDYLSGSALRVLVRDDGRGLTRP